MSIHVIPIAVSLAPGLAVLVRTAGRSRGAWVAAMLGGGGWLVALALRMPLLMSVRLQWVAYAVFASVAAGLFEEVTRALMLRAGFAREELPRRPIALGLGWGLAEALIVYALPVGLYAGALGYGWIDLMPGALERNAAIAVHLSLTLLLSENPRSLGLLAAAVALHSAVNLAAVASLRLLENVWLVELVIAVIAIALLATIAVPRARRLASC